MLRLFASVSACMLVVACSSDPAQRAGGSDGSAGSERGSAGSGSQVEASARRPTPATALEQVQQWAPADTAVAPAEVTVPGLALFSLTARKPAADDDFSPVNLVGVAGGAGGKLLESRELVQAAIDAKADPRTLARVALWVAQDDGEVLEGPRTQQQKKAKVGPPAVARNALVFWVWTTDVPRMIERARLDLATGALEIEPPRVSHAVAISGAITTLGSAAVSRHTVAISTLANACAEPRARQTLLAALANHPRAKTRAAIADEAHKCGAAAVAALINAMEQDKAAMVRSQAASALGRIGDSRARPSLAKAVRGEDANLAWAAKNALGKLK